MKEIRFVKCTKANGTSIDFIVEVDDIITLPDGGYCVHGLDFDKINVLNGPEAYKYCEMRIRDAVANNDTKEHVDWLIGKFYDCYEDGDLAECLGELYHYEVDINDQVNNYLASQGLYY